MLDPDICPACNQRLLPKIQPSSGATARCCQGCTAIFEIKDGQHGERLDQDVAKKEQAREAKRT